MWNLPNWILLLWQHNNSVSHWATVTRKIGEGKKRPPPEHRKSRCVGRAARGGAWRLQAGWQYWLCCLLIFSCEMQGSYCSRNRKASAIFFFDRLTLIQINISEILLWSSIAPLYRNCSDLLHSRNNIMVINSSISENELKKKVWTKKYNTSLGRWRRLIRLAGSRCPRLDGSHRQHVAASPIYSV